MRKGLAPFLTAAVGLLVAGCGTASASGAHAHPQGTPTHRTAAKRAPALHVVSATPTRTAAGTATIRIHLSAALPDPVSAGQLPRLTPRIAGRWTQTSADELQFTPAGAFPAASKVTVIVPVSLTGTDGGHLTRPYQFAYTVGSYSQTRLVQLLAQLGYLPVRFRAAAGQTPPALGDAAAQARAAFAPPRGRFVLGKDWPGHLRTLWNHDRAVVLDGAVRAFESQHDLTMDGIAGPQVWAALLAAAAKSQSNPNGYTYAIASEHTPETLTIWHNGRVVLKTLANTGAPGAATEPGTYPVYEKLQSQVMRGTNLDGSSYADQVYWVSYFHGGDAVHYFNRASYGWPQSLGCVELPWGPAKTSYAYLTYGSLVTVTAP